MAGSITSMVALGSSFAAGPGIRPQVDKWARRSGRNYAHLVGHALGADLTDATVSGATTATILERPQRVGLRTYRPQIEAVTADVDVVTVTAGGNDLGYFGEAARLALQNRMIARPLTRRAGLRLRSGHRLAPRTEAELDATITGLTCIVEEVRHRAPRARVVLVDYLPLFDEHTAPGHLVPLRKSEIDHVRGVARALTGAFETVAARTGCDLVSASDFDRGHAVGAPDAFVLGLTRGRGQGFVFHPTDVGMRATASRILELLAPAQGADRSPGPGSTAG